MKKHSNKNLTFTKDSEKSYVYVKEGKKDIGIFMWHYSKQRWIFEKESFERERKVIK